MSIEKNDKTMKLLYQKNVFSRKAEKQAKPGEDMSVDKQITSDKMRPTVIHSVWKRSTPDD